MVKPRMRTANIQRPTSKWGAASFIRRSMLDVSSLPIGPTSSRGMLTSAFCPPPTAHRAAFPQWHGLRRQWRRNVSRTTSPSTSEKPTRRKASA